MVCRQRKLYTELYKAKLLGQRVNQHELTELEKSLNLVSIVMARTKAESATKSILAARVSKAKSGWFSGWFGNNKENDRSNEDHLLDNLKNEFTLEEKSKLYKAIGYEENSLGTLYPPDFIAHIFRFQISEFKVSVKNDLKPLTTFEIDSCSFEFINRPSSLNKIFNVKIDALNILGTNDVFILRNKLQNQFMTFSFEMNPLDKQFDFSIGLNMKSLYLLYDINTLNQLYRLFMPSENICLDEIQTYAQYKLGDWKQMTLAGLKYSIDKHKQFKFDMNIDPSFVIVPKKANLFHANTFILISLGKFQCVDQFFFNYIFLIGHFSLSSSLVPKSILSEVNSMIKNNPSYVEEIKRLVYERYTCKIMNVQIVLSDREHWKDDIELLDTDRHILCPFEITILIKRSIIPLDPHYPKLTISGM